MRIYVHDSYIKTRYRVGQIAMFAGMGLLLAGAVVALVRPTWWAPVMVALVGGYILSSVGSYYGDRFAGDLAHYKKVPEALKGLDDRFVLLEYLSPTPFLLLDPGGATAILVKTQGGAITLVNGKWQHKQSMGWFRRLGGQETIGQPEREAEAEAERVRQAFQARLPDKEVPVRSIILFVNPKAELEAKDSPVPALVPEKVKEWLRGPGRRPTMPIETRRALLDLLGVGEEETEA